MHKQCFKHANAMKHIWSILKIPSRDVTYAGTKDFLADTIQRIRVRNVSPHALLNCNCSPSNNGEEDEKASLKEDDKDDDDDDVANLKFSPTDLEDWDDDTLGITERTIKEMAMESKRDFPVRSADSSLRLSNFSYHTEPLRPADLFGNHFRIVLRDVDAPKEVVAKAMEDLKTHGFPNYYGSQRFSWFRGAECPAVCLLRRDFIRFAYRLLDYTTHSHTLSELFNRQKRYPLPIQEVYRRECIRKFYKYDVRPSALDNAGFLHIENLDIPKMRDEMPVVFAKVAQCLEEAFQGIDGLSRRLHIQTWQSFMWNQALTARAATVGLKHVMIGDFVIPREWRLQATERESRIANNQAMMRVTAENIQNFTIEDVVHPGFSYGNGQLPDNEVGEIYLQLCDLYNTPWDTNPREIIGAHDFYEPPRPILRKPLDLSFEHDEKERIVTVEFALERGCYATVALTELMKADECIGSEKTSRLPLPYRLWELGKDDPTLVAKPPQVLQDMHKDKEERDELYDGDDGSVSVDTEQSIFEMDGDALFKAEDPLEELRRYNKEFAIRPGIRAELERERKKKQFWEEGLANQVSDYELQSYGNHRIPMRPNDDRKRIEKTLERRIRKNSKGIPSAQLYYRDPMKKQKGMRQELSHDSWNRLL